MGRVVATAVLILVLFAVPASATDWYASPDGASDAACTTPALACSATTAVETKALAGDTVHLAGGDYALPDALAINDSGVTVAGPASGTRARLFVTGDSAINVFVSGVTLRDFDMTAADAGGAQQTLHQNPSTGITGERLRVAATGTTGAAVLVNSGGVVRDSLLTAQATNAAAVLAGRTGGTLVNVTAKAPGTNGRAILASKDYMVDGQTLNLSVVNAILQAGGDDVQAEAAAGRAIAITLDHSAYDEAGGNANATVTEGPGHVIAAPLLAADGVTQLAGSPTIDKGRTDPQLGAFDLFGSARAQGPAPDIGAHEVVVPPPAEPQGQQQAQQPPPATAPVATPPQFPKAPPPRIPPPAFSALKLSKTRFAAGARGVKLSWTLNRGATVVATVLGRVRGRVRAIGAPLRRTSTRLTDALTVTGRGLKPGRYVLSVVATAGAERSAVRRIAFTITAKPKPGRHRR